MTTIPIGTTAGADGRYSLRLLGDGPWTVFARRKDAKSWMNQMDLITIPPGATGWEQDIILR